MTIVAVGIDLAKTLFAVHGVDEHGKPALVRPAIKRTTLLELIAKLLPCQELQPHSDVSTTMSTRMRSRWRPAGRQGRYIRELDWLSECPLPLHSGSLQKTDSGHLRYLIHWQFPRRCRPG